MGWGVQAVRDRGRLLLPLILTLALAVVLALALAVVLALALAVVLALAVAMVLGLVLLLVAGLMPLADLLARLLLLPRVRIAARPLHILLRACSQIPQHLTLPAVSARHARSSPPPCCPTRSTCTSTQTRTIRTG
ncbi:hypothetical protein [Streptomyces platensis]